MKNKKFCIREEVEDLIKEEGDFREFTYKGFTGMCVRMYSGNINGYVKIPDNHPAYRKHYKDVIFSDISVHGGLAYSEDFNPRTSKSDGNWWVGFNTAHVGDFIPYLHPFEVPYVYKTMDWVEKEVKYLIDQILVIRR